MSKRAALIGYVVLVVLMTAGAAQSLSGTNTVDSGDIKDGQVTTADIATNAVIATRVKNESLTGTDIKNASLTGADIASRSIQLADAAGSDVVGAITVSISANKCVTLTASSSGAKAGDQAVLTFPSSTRPPAGMLVYALGVAADGQVALQGCNVTGGNLTMSNAPVRITTWR